jgi:nitroimidazol reductase NimA-like FMN-containing flavoprotein (pyridoxamine 5'-phosphate oxidase superfamily)
MGELDREECLVLLRWEIVGRLAVAAPGEAPTVVPVNFAVDEDTVVFLTSEGEKLSLLAQQPVSLQVDRFDWYRRIGWSVLVRGDAREIDAAEIERLDILPWAPGDKTHAIRIVPTSITGRRLELPPYERDPRGYR